MCLLLIQIVIDFYVCLKINVEYNKVDFLINFFIMKVNHNRSILYHVLVI